MKRTLVALAALLASGHALADECANANNQMEMNQCTAAQYQAADGKLNQTYQQALTLLGETLLAQCLMQVVTINAWNRIAVATRMEHKHP